MAQIFGTPRQVVQLQLEKIIGRTSKFNINKEDLILNKHLKERKKKKIILFQNFQRKKKLEIETGEKKYY